MKIERFVTDSYPERIQLTLDGNPIDLTTLTEVIFYYSRFDEVKDILCQKQTDGYILVPFSEETDCDVVGCFPFDVKSVDVTGNRITFVEGKIDFKKDQGDF
ncbi:hypothetical protein VP501E541_P0035 [Vibrio phage 501E54-1]|nr:hypothetical protein VP501E541_P0035 [Vibrio phage 501E54-1]